MRGDFSENGRSNSVPPNAPIFGGIEIYTVESF